MCFTQQKKYEIIRLVETSEIEVNRTLKEIGINKSTFFNWYGKYWSMQYSTFWCTQRTEWI